MSDIEAIAKELTDAGGLVVHNLVKRSKQFFMTESANKLITKGEYEQAVKAAEARLGVLLGVNPAAEQDGHPGDFVSGLIAKAEKGSRETRRLTQLAKSATLLSEMERFLSEASKEFRDHGNTEMAHRTTTMLIRAIEQRRAVDEVLHDLASPPVGG